MDKILIFCFSMFFFCSISVAQNELKNGVNLPPGVVVKEIPQINYSHKLNALVDVSANVPVDNGFLKNHSEEDLSEMKKSNFQSYEYYREAVNYYNKLSNKVKATFTGPELWDIYYYDQELKEKLLTIK
jgi:hypothetical protein